MTIAPSEEVLEVRFTPNPKVLDYRGEIAELTSLQMSLSEWLINANRIDIYDKAETVRGFVSFRNAGFVVHNPPTDNYFCDQATKFIRFIFSLKPFLNNPVAVTRLGVRSRKAFISHLSFADLFDRYTKHVVTLTPDAGLAFNAKLSDIGGHLDFTTEYGKMSTMSGAMEKQQLKQFFEFTPDNDLPDVAFYVDIDYWMGPSVVMPVKDIANLVKQFSEENIKRRNDLARLVLGEQST